MMNLQVALHADKFLIKSNRNQIIFSLDLIRFRKDFSVCTKTTFLHYCKKKYDKSSNQDTFAVHDSRLPKGAFTLKLERAFLATVAEKFQSPIGQHKVSRAICRPIYPAPVIGRTLKCLNANAPQYALWRGSLRRAVMVFILSSFKSIHLYILIWVIIAYVFNIPLIAYMRTVQ